MDRTLWCQLPRDVLIYNVLPHCDIDIRLAFDVKPRRMQLPITLQRMLHDTMQKHKRQLVPLLHTPEHRVQHKFTSKYSPHIKFMISIDYSGIDHSTRFYRYDGKMRCRISKEDSTKINQMHGYAESEVLADTRW